MEMTTAAPLFATLGHPGRLAVFRLLMRFAPQGARPTEMAQALAMKPNTLSHHLGDLAQAGLITARREGRSLYYAVDLGAARGLVDFLLNDCCRGRPDLCPPPLPTGDRIMDTAPLNVLFICSGNSARSIFAEAILRDLGQAKFRAFSAGTRPGTTLNPFALEVLARNGHSIDGLRAKHIAEFQAEDAPKMDFVFTVCDLAATEDCAPWPGQPMTAHWGVADPVKAQGSDAEKGLAFAHAYGELRRRIQAFAALPFRELENLALQQRLDHIGQE